MPVYIPSSTDLISEEGLEESAEKELEVLFGKIRKGKIQSRWDIINKVEQNFIPVVEDILKKLEEEKRSAETLILEKIQETQILIGLLEKAESTKIKNELNALKKFLRGYYRQEQLLSKTEKRLGKGKKIPGFFMVYKV